MRNCTVQVNLCGRDGDYVCARVAYCGLLEGSGCGGISLGGGDVVTILRFWELHPRTSDRSWQALL